MNRCLFLAVFCVLPSCTRINPAVCCETPGECQAVGFTEPNICTSGVCVANACVSNGCDGNEDCRDPEAPTCTGGVCVSDLVDAGIDGPATAPTDAKLVDALVDSRPIDSRPIDSRPIDSTPIDSTPVCVPELLFQRDAFFTNAKVFRVDLQSFMEHSISNGTDTDTDPEWSPDGTKVVLIRNGSSIFTVNADGSNVHQIDSQSGQFLSGPKWSPDGTRVVFASQPTAGGQSGIFSASATGTTSVNLSPSADAQGPIAWSPDGTQLLFVSNRTGNLDVFKMAAANGANPTNLTNRSGADGAQGPQWSPDGKKVVLDASHIWIENADGSGLQNLTGTMTIQGDPIFSPDGRIYYVQDPGGAGQLMVMNANGTNAHPIDPGSPQPIDLGPVPSPDGTMLAWTSNRDGNFEIYVAAADGTNPTRVTSNAAPDSHPRWRPCPH